MKRSLENETESGTRCPQRRSRVLMRNNQSPLARVSGRTSGSHLFIERVAAKWREKLLGLLPTKKGYVATIVKTRQ